MFPYYGSALGVYGDGGYKFDGFTTGRGGIENKHWTDVDSLLLLEASA